MEKEEVITHKVNCPERGNCVHGTILKCKADEHFSDSISFTWEDTYPLCPRYQKKKETKEKENGR